MKRPDEDNLDRLIARLMPEDSPELDFEQWRHRHREAIEDFRRRQRSRKGWVRYAAAAVVLAAAGLGLLRLDQPAKDDEARTDRRESVAAVEQTGAEMMSLLHLNEAYRRGGLEAVDEQYEKAYVKLGPRTGTSMGMRLEGILNDEERVPR